MNKGYSAVKGILYDFNYKNEKINITGETYSDFVDFRFFIFRHMFNPLFRSYYCLHKKKI